MIGYMISLSRKLGVRNIEMHHNIWNKASKNCHEIRNKILGIIGYGHIGTQLSVLAESMGMAVIFHDILPLMPLGNAKPVESLNDLLKQSDFVSVHVPETDETRLMIGKEQISIMKRGSYLLNASRGSIVDLEAVKESLVSGHLGGAAIDVFPSEPQKNGKFLHYFHDFCDMAEIWKANGKKNIKLNENHIRNINTLNLILTPHIGGSTEEAQIAIGSEVATSIANYLDEGSTMKSVNLPELQLRLTDWKGNGCRILNVHYNVPGVLKVTKEGSFINFMYYHL